MRGGKRVESMGRLQLFLGRFERGERGEGKERGVTGWTFDRVIALGWVQGLCVGDVSVAESADGLGKEC